MDPTYATGYHDCVSLHDAVIPWPVVDLVFMLGQSDCPICLHSLRCPRVTSCGHIFDYVCILQHFAHANSANAKCPLCSSNILAADLRPCVFRDMSVLHVGIPIIMRLVSREKKSMIAHPHPPLDHSKIPANLNADSAFFSRIGFADEKCLIQLISRSMDELRLVLREEPTLTHFVNVAMQDLKQKKKDIRARRAALHQNLLPEHVHQLDQKKRDNLWYFYQADDTSNVFLHPVNHRCLTTEFNGDFDATPTGLSGEVLQIENYIMDETLRKRYRFLEHLTDGCEFSFVELDLAHILSQKTLSAHRNELKKRRSTRKRMEIAAAHEDNVLEKKRIESLREYFSSQVGNVMRSAQRKTVDSRDASSFPALRMGSSVSDTPQEESKAIIETRLSVGTVPGSAWGSEVSSYSSVTSNMGLFPSLGPQVALCSSPKNANALQGAWGPSSSETSSQNPSSSPMNVTSPVRNSRKGRKSHGKTKILISNAGSPHRR